MPSRKSESPRAPRRDRGRPRGAPIERLILASTLEELGAHGLAGFSVDRVAARADVNKTSVYRRWPTKDALVAAAMETVLRDASAQLPDTGDLEGDLLGCAKQAAALMRSPIGRALFRATVEAPDDGTSAPRRVSTLTTAPARAVLDRARARNATRADLRGDILFTALVGAIMHRLMVERRPATVRWLTDLVDTLVRGAAPRPTPG